MDEVSLSQAIAAWARRALHIEEAPVVDGKDQSVIGRLGRLEAKLDACCQPAQVAVVTWAFSAPVEQEE